MGVTIHFQGKLRSLTKAKAFYEEAAKFCKIKNWEISNLVREEVKLQWEIHEEETIYNGTANTFRVLPHPGCEPIVFQIAKNGFYQDFCKTQFAPIEIHIQIVELFKNLDSLLEENLIEDEGEYWDTEDREGLEKHFQSFFKAMNEALTEDAEYYGPVKLENGRIIDLMKD